MIEKIITWSAKNKFTIFLITSGLLVYGAYVLKNLPVDAIPDLSEKQVIVFTEWQGRSPTLIEDQITYPVSSALQGLAGVKAVRSFSMFGKSSVFVIFNDDVDIYFARNRIQEKLGEVKGILPKTAISKMGPEGTGVGHIFWYTLQSENYDLGFLRALQDWTIRYQLASVEGVAEVASIGGFVKQYQIELLPDKLYAYKISVSDIIRALTRNNNEVGGKLLESRGHEHIIRGQAYIKSKQDIENIAVKTSSEHLPVFIKQLAKVQLGADSRRGAIEKDGSGETVGGVIVMRDGENTSEVIKKVKRKIENISSFLPKGVKIHTAYDRSVLIEAAEYTLIKALIEAGITVSIIVMLFLLHAQSVIRILIVIPISVFFTFIFMKMFNITSNIMSLGGIILAIGVVVDSSIILIENAHRNISNVLKKNKTLSKQDYIDLSIMSAKQVGRAIFFSELIILVAFLPVFFLSGQEGKLFKPLVFTKTFAMLSASIIVLTVTPALMIAFVGSNFKKIERNPISIFFEKSYSHIMRWVLNHKTKTLLMSVAILLLSIPIMMNTGSEFMPSLDEGSILYMPVTTPNVSMPEMIKLLQRQDAIIKKIPEVKSVLGKIGGAETATDNAPISMIETIILLNPRETWRPGITKKDLIAELNDKLRMPGVRNGWTQPIINRINMLSTGVRTDIGLKVYGPDLSTTQNIANQAESLIKQVEGAVDVVAESFQLGSYLNINVKKDVIGRYGLSAGDVQDVIEMAIGGQNLGMVFEGRERYPIRVRFAKDYRDNIKSLKNLIIPINSKMFMGKKGDLSKNSSNDIASILSSPQKNENVFIPLSYIADIKLEEGPAVISSENGNLRSTVFFNARGKDIGSVVKDAKKIVKQKLNVPPGYFLDWTGHYEQKMQADKTLMIIIPLALLIIFLMLYYVFKDIKEAFIVILSVPFSLTGGIFMIFLLDYNFSVAVWVGFIALYGIAVETGVVMVVYLHESLDKKLRSVENGEKNKISVQEIFDATMEGSVMRLRPKLMTVFTAASALIPIMLSTGIGADVMKPIVAPMIGGLLTSAAHVLIVTPVLFALTKEHLMKKNRLHISKMSEWIK